MKYSKIFFLFSISIILIISLFYIKFEGISKQEQKTAHIYIDFASAPALFQMVDALKQNPKDPKLMIFKRFKALEADDETLLSINAQMVDTKFLGEKIMINLKRWLIQTSVIFTKNTLTISLFFI